MRVKMLSQEVKRAVRIRHQRSACRWTWGWTRGSAADLRRGCRRQSTEQFLQISLRLLRQRMEGNAHA